VLVIVSRPLKAWKVVLVVGMAGLFVAACLTPGVNTLFSLQHRPDTAGLLKALAFGAVAALVIDLVLRTPYVSRAWRPGSDRLADQ